MRLLKITGVDLTLFEFDYDLTWVGFFVNADEVVYGRYGGRDAKSPDERMSLPGLKYAMRAALDAHKKSQEKPRARPDKPLLAENYADAKKMRRGECIHCHQVNELRRAEEKSTGKWQRDSLWVYPLPENLGLTLEVDRGNGVRSVAADSPAAKAGLKPGDVVRKVNGVPIASFADAQYALHRAPVKGETTIAWERGGTAMTGTLALADGWRKTNVTWRPSMLDILPSMPLDGDDLTPKEKQALGLPEKRLAFRQGPKVYCDAQAWGVQAGDVVIGIDNLPLEMTMADFLGHVRKNFLVGDKITLNVLRGGKRVDLEATLK